MFFIDLHLSVFIVHIFKMFRFIKQLCVASVHPYKANFIKDSFYFLKYFSYKFYFAFFCECPAYIFPFGHWKDTSLAYHVQYYVIS